VTAGGVLNRSIRFGIAGALLALLVLWFARHADVPIQSDRDGPSVRVEESPTEPPVVHQLEPQAEPPAASPQAGILRTEPNIFTVMDGRPFPEVQSPPWSESMESAILSHVAQHPSLTLTDLEVQCEDAGCVIFMGGPSIPLGELNFAGFAQENGFSFVVIRDRDGTDGKIVMLRR
jgi:hypothetical protein